MDTTSTNLDRYLTQLSLALYGSSKRVEPLPRIRVYQPWETVSIVAGAGGDL